MKNELDDSKKHHRQIISSMILIIVIPVLIIANFFWQIYGFKQNLQQEIKQRADMVTGLISTEVQEYITVNSTELNSTQPSVLKKLSAEIEALTKTNKNIKEVAVLKPQGSSFEIIATNLKENYALSVTSSENSEVWVNESNISRELFQNGHYWQNFNLIKDQNGKKIALLNLKIDLNDSDAAYNLLFNRFLLIIVIMLVLIIALLVNHIRFLRYVNLYDKLKEVDEMKDEFISIASHELKTPMATIKGYINMMLEGLTGKIDPVARDHLIKVNDNVERLDILVSELLDVSRLEQERMQFDLQQVSLPKITEKVINNMMPYAKRKNLELIEEKFAQNLPNVFIYPDRFEQVLTNLISNAIKYTSKGSVKVVYSLTDDYLLASVKDTGIGMSIKDMERLFEKFYRIKNEKTAEIPGTGLGLWLSKSIAEKMNCQLEVKSELGKGSDFTIKIPLVKE